MDCGNHVYKLVEWGFFWSSKGIPDGFSKGNLDRSSKGNLDRFSKGNSKRNPDTLEETEIHWNENDLVSCDTDRDSTGEHRKLLRWIDFVLISSEIHLRTRDSVLILTDIWLWYKREPEWEPDAWLRFDLNLNLSLNLNIKFSLNFSLKFKQFD